MSHWKEHKARILRETGLWAGHARDPDSTSRADVISALNDVELAVHEAAKREERIEEMNGKG